MKWNSRILARSAAVSPRLRAAAMALVRNPFAGGYAEELQPAMEDLKPLGRELTERLIAALGGDAGAIDGYGKGGDMVNQMRRRFAASGNGAGYSHVIVFGGVNDLGLGAAIAVFLFLLVIPILALNIRRFRREA